MGIAFHIGREIIKERGENERLTPIPKPNINARTGSNLTSI